MNCSCQILHPSTSLHAQASRLCNGMLGYKILQLDYIRLYKKSWEIKFVDIFRHFNFFCKTEYNVVVQSHIPALHCKADSLENVMIC